MATGEELFREEQSKINMQEEVETEIYTEKESQGFDFSFIFTRTKEKDLSEYENHPLAFKKNEGLYRILRGLEGLFDSLDFALIDIVIGTYQLFFSKPKEV